MYALIYQEIVIQLETTPFDVNPAYSWVECDEAVAVGYTYIDGVFSPPYVPPLTIDEQLILFNQATLNQLDLTANSRLYDSAASIISYANSTNLTWKIEADTFIAWRDAVYAYTLPILNDVSAGEPAPTMEQFLAGFPVIVWPAS